jgi:hypothetical protein
VLYGVARCLRPITRRACPVAARDCGALVTDAVRAIDPAASSIAGTGPARRASGRHLYAGQFGRIFQAPPAEVLAAMQALLRPRSPACGACSQCSPPSGILAPAAGLRRDLFRHGVISRGAQRRGSGSWCGERLFGSTSREWRSRAANKAPRESPGTRSPRATGAVSGRPAADAVA